MSLCFAFPCYEERQRPFQPIHPITAHTVNSYGDGSGEFFSLRVKTPRQPEHRGGLITISAAKIDGEQITHAIHSATRVRVERTDTAADVAMQIESAEGTTTILRLKTPALPETVDGLPKR